MYSLILVPFRASFLLTDGTNAIWEDILWAIPDVIGDIILIADIFLKFFTPYSGSDGILVYEYKKTALHYVKSFWFYLDVASSLPVDWVVIFIIRQWVPFFRLNRVFRFFRFNGYFGQLEVSLGVSTAKIRIVKSVLLVFLSAQVLTCLWWLVIFNEDNAVITAFTKRPNLLESPVMSRWLVGYQWTFCTMTGYGGTIPASVQQSILSIVVLAVGIALFASVIGTVGSLIITMDESATRSRQQREEILSYLNYRKLPKAVQERVRDYYLYLWKSRKGWDEQTIMEDLPHYLRLEISLQMNQDLIKKVPLFKDVDKTFLSSIVMKLQPRIFTPFSNVVKKGDIGREMYFISTGFVEVISEDNPPKVWAKLGEGSFFGEIALVFDQRRMATVRAGTYCDLYILDQDAFKEMELDYPDQVNRIKEEAQKRLGGGK
jgi:hypothetical protein